MSTPDPQHPADPPADDPHPGEAAATEQPPGPSPEKPTTQVPTPPPDQPTTPAYGTALTYDTYGTGGAQPYDPLPGQSYDPRTGLPLGPPPGSPYGQQGTSAYNAPYGPPPGYGPQQPGWYPSPGYTAYVPSPTNGMAVASLVLGILWIYWAGSIMALIFGYVARQQIAQRGESGGGLATAGIVLGWIGVGMLILLLFFLSVVDLAPSPGY
jgi:hypothetical protein